MRQRMLVILATVLLVLRVSQSSSVSAQQPSQTRQLQFEAAAIKPGDPQYGVYSSTSTGTAGGQFRMINVPLKQWLELGLTVNNYAVKAPPWLDTTRFDLVARLPDTKTPDQHALAQMMKALLIERFGLRWHEEFQSCSGYELIAGKNVLIRPSGLLERLKGHGASSGPSFVGGLNMSMAEFAEALSRSLGKPVVDRTQLTGVFDIKLLWSSPNEVITTDERRYGKEYGLDVENLPSSVSTALREQLGLQLQSTKLPSKVVVVDYISHQPTAN